MKEALDKQGFFNDKEPHKLIICGDLYDRGKEALKLQSFILGLMEKDEVILIKGNHEDLALDVLYNWNRGSYHQRHHHSNGTIDTICQLTESNIEDLTSKPMGVYEKFLNNPYIQTIIPKMIDFYETDHYIFTHGWIPCTMIRTSSSVRNYIPIEDWRNASKIDWDKARWINGMEVANGGIIEKNKTIVCGHWHCSFGHAHYEGDGGEFDNNPNFTPYYGKGIIALDACTPMSKKINCIVIED